MIKALDSPMLIVPAPLCHAYTAAPLVSHSSWSQRSRQRDEQTDRAATCEGVNLQKGRSLVETDSNGVERESHKRT